MSAIKILKEIKANKNKEYANNYLKFFKCYKGGYGEGDKFYGLRAPTIRSIAHKYYASISHEDLNLLIRHPYHEVRTCALVMIMKRLKKDNNVRKIYLKNLKYINNWDLVDISASHVIGDDVKLIKKLSKSKNLWIQRISIIATHSLIRKNQFDLTLKLSKYFINHEHNLIHRAIGWMLREIGKRNKKILMNFLIENHAKLPRTSFQYAVEKLTLNEKKKCFYYI